MKTPFKTLTVAENEGRSDTIVGSTVVNTSSVLGSYRELPSKDVLFEIDLDGNLKINVRDNLRQVTLSTGIFISKLDIDGMIDFLQQARDVVEQERLYKIIAKKGKY